MSASAVLSGSPLGVAPGATTSTTVRVANRGTVVDELLLEPLGPAAAWTTVEPARVVLLPGQEAEAEVRFSPPSTGGPPAGPVPFAVLVSSREHPDSTTAEEGTVEVLPAPGLAGELGPATVSTRGYRRGRFRMAVDNLGNTSLDLTLLGADLDEQLRVRTSPQRLLLPPGTSGLVTVEARVRRRQFTGAPVLRPFTVVARSADEEPPPLVLEAALVNRAVLPPGAGRLALLALGALLALAALWHLVLRPAVQSTAQEAAAAQSSQAAAQADMAAAAAADNAAALSDLAAQQRPGAGGPADKAAADAASAARAARQAQAAAAARASAAPVPEAVPAGLGEPFATRLQAEAQEQSPSLGFGEDATFSLTDLFVENPAGDRGLLVLSRGEAVLIRTRLENFRDLDYHFVAPVRFGPGQRLQLSVSCENPAGAPCTPGVLVNGYLRRP